MKKNKYPKIKRITLLLLIAVAVITGCKKQEKICNAVDGCFDPALFEANLKQTFTGKHTGFAFVIRQEDKILRGYEEGFKRTSADGTAVPFSMFTNMFIASMSKTITAIATMQVLKQNNLTVDTKIQPFLPAGWVLGNNIDKITFRMLLTHTGGFRSKINQAACNDDHVCNYTGLKAMVTGGVLSVNQGQGCYQNSNFGLLRILIVKLAGTNYVSDASADKYIEYVRNNIFQPSNIDLSKGCKPDAANPALYYDFNSPAAKGLHIGDLTSQAGGYGWVLSPVDFSNIINGLVSTEKIVPKAVRDQLLTEQLGCYEGISNHGKYYHHNGGWGDNISRGLGTIWVYFEKTKHVVALFENSLPTTVGDAGLVAEAYDKAWTK